MLAPAIPPPTITMLADEGGSVLVKGADSSRLARRSGITVNLLDDRGGSLAQRGGRARAGMTRGSGGAPAPTGPDLGVVGDVGQDALQPEGLALRVPNDRRGVAHVDPPAVSPAHPVVEVDCPARAPADGLLLHDPQIVLRV